MANQIIRQKPFRKNDLVVCLSPLDHHILTEQDIMDKIWLVAEVEPDTDCERMYANWQNDPGDPDDYDEDCVRCSCQMVTVEENRSSHCAAFFQKIGIKRSNKYFYSQRYGTR